MKQNGRRFSIPGCFIYLQTPQEKKKNHHRFHKALLPRFDESLAVLFRHRPFSNLKNKKKIESLFQVALSFYDSTNRLNSQLYSKMTSFSSGALDKYCQIHTYSRRCLLTLFSGTFFLKNKNFGK